jgi:hypothetical protein
VILWVVGEYGTLSGQSATVLMDTLCAAVEVGGLHHARYVIHCSERPRLLINTPSFID